MDENKRKGNIHSVETFGSVDGPGVRFVIFMQGCRMRCRFCHNADTWSEETNTLMSAEELLDKAERYRSYWGKEGGITVSGGEPLLQTDFLIELFTLAKQRGISTVLDTAGQPFNETPEYLEKMDRLMSVTDLVMMDIKHIDTGKHFALTSQPNDNILAMFRYLDRIHQPIWIRMVLVPGVNDDPQDIETCARFIGTLDNVEKIEVLPYHTFGAYKWKELGMNYELEGIQEPSGDHCKQVLAKLGQYQKKGN